MKDKRRLILFIITLLIWFLCIQIWQRHKVTEAPPPEKQEQTTSEKTDKTADPDDKAKPVPSEEGTKPLPVEEKPEITEKVEPKPEEKEAEKEETTETEPEAEPELFMLNTDDDENKGYLVECTNQGAAIKNLTFKEFYKNERTKEEKLTILSEEETGLKALQISGFTLRQGTEKTPIELKGTKLDKRVWDIVKKDQTSAVFETSLAPGITLEKKIEYIPDKKLFSVIISQKNNTNETIRSSYDLIASPGIVPEYLKPPQPALKGVIAVKNESGKEKLEAKYAKQVSNNPLIQEEGAFSWIAGCNKYFAVIVKIDPKSLIDPKPLLAGKISAITLQPDEDERPEENKLNVATSIRIQKFITPPEKKSEIKFTFHVLPMRKEELKKVDIEHTQLISPGKKTFGLVDTLADFFLFILKGIHVVFPNWGISIIIMTLLVAAALYPLNKKGQMSMHRMQKLQPEMKRLRKKHKGNKQKMNEEVMKLYHKHGINPVGGCFPLLIQMPIFIGLLYALRGSFDLRQSGFLWINDLALPDALFALNLGFISKLNLLPILMTVAMLIQNKMNAPPAADKSDKEPDTQKQMQGAMKIMPWVMLVLFYNFPSGLALYWTTNTVIRIFESYHIKKRLIPRLEEKLAASADSTNKG